MAYVSKLNELIKDGINSLELWIKTVKSTIETKAQFEKLSPHEEFVYNYVKVYHDTIDTAIKTKQVDTNTNSKKAEKMIVRKKNYKSDLVSSVESAMRENVFTTLMSEADVSCYDGDEDIKQDIKQDIRKITKQEIGKYINEDCEDCEDEHKGSVDAEEEGICTEEMNRLAQHMQERRKLAESQLNADEKNTDEQDVPKTPKAIKGEVLACNTASVEKRTIVQPNGKFGIQINNVEGHMAVDEMEQKAPTITALLRIDSDQREQLYTNIFLTAKANVSNHMSPDNSLFQEFVNREADRLLKIYMDTH